MERVRKLGSRMADEEIIFMSGKEQMKIKGEERVKSWRNIGVVGGMILDRERKRSGKRYQWEWEKGIVA